MAGQGVLFVCRANVCRSPALQFMVASVVGEHDLTDAWSFSSAGTVATAGQPMCAASAASLQGLDGGEDFALRHRSRLLSKELVRTTGLILVTSQAERSVVTRLDADARSRTFTMVEAGLLIEATLRGEDPLRAPPAGLAQLVDAMNARRGKLAAPGRPGIMERLRTREHAPSSYDIGDVHEGTAKRHQPVLDDLRWTARHLNEAFTAIIDQS
jgi:protein-tyrosine-phosphatase